MINTRQESGKLGTGHRYYIRVDLNARRKGQLNQCYDKAALYYSVVKKTTDGKKDAGKWGHSDNHSVYPTYTWDKW